ncbi:HPr kinase/phosphorylase [Ruegeria faecimaris]|nr:serine kinase [Ruegeria faecimaris]
MSTSALSSVEHKDTAIVHASCVAIADRAVLIVGPSGTGKSALSLQMMALGADLVADDRVRLYMDGNLALAEAAPNIGGLIEARGLGLLRAVSVGPVPVGFVVDMAQEEPERLPEPRSILILRQTVPLLRGAGVSNLPAALLLLMKNGCADPEWPNQ